MTHNPINALEEFGDGRDYQLEAAKQLLSSIKCSVCGVDFKLRIERDNKHPVYGRIFIQFIYTSPCSKSGEIKEWRGGKHYLSEHMTKDELVKRCYAAFEAAVKHEVMEGFTFDGIVVFNPHLSYQTLCKVSNEENETNREVELPFWRTM